MKAMHSGFPEFGCDVSAVHPGLAWPGLCPGKGGRGALLAARVREAGGGGGGGLCGDIAPAPAPAPALRT